MKHFVKILLLATLVGMTSAASAMGPMGLWTDEKGKARMKVAVCDDGTLCARIVWLRQPNDKNGKPLVDDLNGDSKLRNRPIIGVPVAYNMVKTRANEWSGRVYDPQRGGQTYKGTMTLLKNGRMKVTGCLMFICETEYWNPVTQ